MRKYMTPKSEITKFQSEDILVTSSALSETDGGFIADDPDNWNS